MLYAIKNNYFSNWTRKIS